MISARSQRGRPCRGSGAARLSPQGEGARRSGGLPAAVASQSAASAEGGQGTGGVGRLLSARTGPRRQALLALGRCEPTGDAPPQALLGTQIGSDRTGRCRPPDIILPSSGSKREGPGCVTEGWRGCEGRGAEGATGVSGVMAAASEGAER